MNDIFAKAPPQPYHEYNGWWAKRQDLACKAGPEFPGGAKMQAWGRIAARRPGLPLLVGCAANSTAQIAAAAAGALLGAKVVIFVAARAKRTEATAYAAAMGAGIREVRPGYLGVCKARASEYAAGLKGGAAEWDPREVAVATMAEVAGLPAGVKRILVPCGAGATAAGIMAGLAVLGRLVPVVACAVSTFAAEEDVRAMAAAIAKGRPLPPLALLRVAGAYDKPARGGLPGGEPLDPFYAAKVLPLVEAGDCLWVPGCRPPEAMPTKVAPACRG